MKCGILSHLLLRFAWSNFVQLQLFTNNETERH